MSLPKSARSFASLALLFALAACQPQATAPDTAADEAAIQAVAENWPKAYNDKNADALAALYTEDARTYPPGGPMISGRAAIREFFAADVASNWAPTTVAHEESVIAGDWAWRTGTWSAATTPPLTGKYAEVWRRTAEGWRIHRDIWNADAAPPAAPADTPPAAEPAQQ
jgi:uncharacterized protein (TIGR02246 family)